MAGQIGSFTSSSLSEFALIILSTNSAASDEADVHRYGPDGGVVHDREELRKNAIKDKFR
jgi:hypothetical protein